jgi:hypothetical protein
MNKAETLVKEMLRNIYSETTIEHVIHPRKFDSISNPDGFSDKEKQ